MPVVIAVIEDENLVVVNQLIVVHRYRMDPTFIRFAHVTNESPRSLPFNPTETHRQTVHSGTGFQPLLRHDPPVSREPVKGNHRLRRCRIYRLLRCVRGLQRLEVSEPRRQVHLKDHFPILRF